MKDAWDVELPEDVAREPDAQVREDPALLEHDRRDGAAPARGAADDLSGARRLFGGLVLLVLLYFVGAEEGALSLVSAIRTRSTGAPCASWR